MKVLIIDNYDSFTYNLYQYIGEILTDKEKKFSLVVKRNDEITIDEIRKEKFDKIVISPGPGDSSDEKYFGVCSKVITEIGKSTPVLGVCLGMQGIAHFFGGRVVRAKAPMHGKASIINHDGKGVFKGLPQNLCVMRYHSLIVDSFSLPNVLEVTATVENGQKNLKVNPFDRLRTRSQRSKDSGKHFEIMGLRHKKYPIEGMQFHPESFATEAGKKMLENFLYNIN